LIKHLTGEKNDSTGIIDSCQSFDQPHTLYPTAKISKVKHLLMILLISIRELIPKSRDWVHRIPRFSGLNFAV